MAKKVQKKKTAVKPAATPPQPRPRSRIFWT